MKKTYMIPSTTTTTIHSQHLLQASVGINTGNSSDVSYSRRRSFNVWDDDEEE